MITFTGKKNPNYVQFAHGVRSGIREAFPQGTPEVKSHFLQATYETGLSIDTTITLFEAFLELEEVEQ